MILHIEAENTVYSGMCPQNGSDPLWCSSSCCIGRIGDRVLATGQEKLPGIEPLNDTRWTLHELVDGNWQRVLDDPVDRTREPCPLAVFPDGRLFISANPDVSRAGGQPDQARPEILEIDTADPGVPIRRHVPIWDNAPPFTHHSYRAFAADADEQELILFQNVGSDHSAWALLDRDAQWLTGELPWPAYEDGTFEVYDSGRSCVNYMTAALHNRQAHVCGVSPHNKWRRVRDNPDLMGRRWGNRFRRLQYTWTPAVGEAPFSDWLVVDHTEDTGGWLFPGDMHLAPDGSVHLLYTRLPIDQELRDLHFPDIPRVYSLEYACLRDGHVTTRRTLAIGGEGHGPTIPYDLAGEGLTYRWRSVPLRTSRIPTPRFHATPSGRLCAIFYVSGTDAAGNPLAQNRMVEIGPDEPPPLAVTLPLQHPFVQYYTASPRAGSPVSDTIDFLGFRTDGLGLFDDRPTTISYARLRIEK